MTLLLLLNPKNWPLGGEDGADVFRRRVATYKKKQRREEEALAAKILEDRLLRGELPDEKNARKAARKIQLALNRDVERYKSLTDAQKKKIKRLIVLMIADLI